MDATDIIILAALAGFVVWLIEENGGVSSIAGDLSQAGGYVDQGVATLGGDIVSETATSSDIDTLARTIRGEAANQSDEAKLGVGNVIMNRVKDVENFPSEAGSIEAICKQRGQFDCWFPNLGSASDYRLTVSPWTNSASDQACLAIAKACAGGTVADNTAGAEFYFDSRVSTPPAAWGAVEKTVQIGTLSFYRRATV